MKRNRNVLMEKFKKQYDGNVVRENGKWYWIYEGAKSLISNSWLMSMLKKKPEQAKGESTIEIQQHQDEVMAQNVGLDTPVEEQKSENETTTLSEEELKEIKNAKRREKRKQKKLEKQKQDEQPE